MNNTRTFASLGAALAALLFTGTAHAVVSISVANSDFEAPVWVSNNGSWSLQSVPAGGLIMNTNALDPHFGVVGWGKTAQIMMGNSTWYTAAGASPNGEGAYTEQNNSTSPAGEYYNDVNGSLPPPANGHQFFTVLASMG